jgi:hypothetical protein
MSMPPLTSSACRRSCALWADKRRRVGLVPECLSLSEDISPMSQHDKKWIGDDHMFGWLMLRSDLQALAQAAK